MIEWRKFYLENNDKNPEKILLKNDGRTNYLLDNWVLMFVLILLFYLDDSFVHKIC